METRIYVVTDHTGVETPRLIEASSQAQAIKHVAKRYYAAPASAKTVAAAMLDGIKLEQPTEKPDGE